MTGVRILTGKDAVRPNEPALARLNWLLEVHPGILDVPLDAVDYRGQPSGNVIEDIVDNLPGAIFDMDVP